MKRIALTALMLAALPATASAQGAVTGDRLLISCREFKQSIQYEGTMYRVTLGRATECNHYMRAVYDLFWSNETKGSKISLLKTCQPLGQPVSIPQVVNIFVVFAEANPNSLHLNGALLATIALRKAFPCPEERAA
jgi:hypothetical protein